ncbi:MAG: flagellar biosynthesis anti-sigma factor FlgM [Phycisphaerales bacterium]|nr:flagellar biosynthesis anti-sigma factor FlgM [Phycisphaerales bacterium]
MSDIALTERGQVGQPALSHSGGPRQGVGRRPSDRFGRANEPLEAPSASAIQGWRASLQEGGPVRWDRVRAIRASIASGDYLTSNRLDEALTQLVRDLDH